jgi:hypothetical protein
VLRRHLAKEVLFVPSNNPQQHVSIVLECLECGTRDDSAKGWRAYLEPDGYGVLIFCPDCAHREFDPN